MRHARGLERHRAAIAVAAAVVVVIGLVTAGWILLGSATAPGAASGAALAGVTENPTPPAAESLTPSPTLSVTPAPTKKATPTRKATPPKPRPTQKPPAKELPPPPPPPKPTPTTGCPTFEGTAAPAAQVRQALSAAGGTDYWARPGVSPAMGVDGPVDLPSMSVPAPLMNAIAMAESTWRSNVIACDGGIGTMQIMAGTADFVHTRFNSSFDVHSLDGNTAIGAAYLQWLTVYFGIFYFGESFDLDASAPVGAGGATVMLRDAVIAAYNVGHRGVENEHDTPDDPSDDTLEIPNQWYVDRVAGYLDSCPCDEF